MTDGEQRDPLWATSLADQPRRPFEALGPEPDEPREAPPRRADAPRPPAGQRGLAVGGLAAITMIALAMALADRASLTIKAVPSSWEAVPMSCDTTRLERDGRAMELFRCRALGGGVLPPGLYRSPGSQWTSDLTRRDARASEIEISPEGELTGWAAY